MDIIVAVLSVVSHLLWWLPPTLYTVSVEGVGPCQEGVTRPFPVLLSRHRTKLDPKPTEMPRHTLLSVLLAVYRMLHLKPAATRTGLLLWTKLSSSIVYVTATKVAVSSTGSEHPAQTTEQQTRVDDGLTSSLSMHPEESEVALRRENGY